MSANTAFSTSTLNVAGAGDVEVVRVAAIEPVVMSVQQPEQQVPSLMCWWELSTLHGLQQFTQGTVNC